MNIKVTKIINYCLVIKVENSSLLTVKYLVINPLDYIV